MIPQKITALTESTLKDLSSQDLNNPNAISRILELAEDDQYLSEPMAARDFYENIDKVLSQFGSEISSTENRQKMYFVLSKMKWQALPALDKKIRSQILTDNLIATLSTNINILENLDGYLYVYEFGVGPDSSERQVFLAGLNQNKERLGAEQLSLKTGETVAPIVGNWLKDFISYTDAKSIQGTSYQVTQYLYSSPNVKRLKPEEKEILVSIIQIFNHLSHPNYIPEIIGGPGSSPDNAPGIQEPTPPRTVPTSPTLAPQPKISFDQKIAAVSAPVVPSHGQDLEALKKKIEQNKVSFAPKAQSIPSVSPSTQGGGNPSVSAVKMTPQEIVRETITPELPAYKAPVAPVSDSIKPIVQAPVISEPLLPIMPQVSVPSPIAPTVAWPTPRPVAQSVPPMVLAELNDVKSVDDLKKIEMGHLRQAPINSQAELIKTKIITLARVNQIVPYYAVIAFEQSPLFKTYLRIGAAMIHDNEVDRSEAFRKAIQESGSDMTQVEFEKIADLRKEIERL